MDSAFPTIDPAPASLHSPLAANTQQSTTQSVPELQATLMDTSLPLFARYRAMFALRNDGGREAVLALATGFHDESALFRCVAPPMLTQPSSPHTILLSPFPPRSLLYDRFRSHEIAYVFGQLSSPDSVPSLIEVLRRPHEEDMVRHEAAEALGGIATDECLPILQEFAKDETCPRVVKESCEVALDMVSLRLPFLSCVAPWLTGSMRAMDVAQYEYERSNRFVPLIQAQ